MLRSMLNRLRYRRLLRLVGLMLVIVVGWYVVNRLASPFRMVTVVYDAKATVSSASRNADEFRVAAYNIAHARGLHERNYGREVQRQRPSQLRAIGELLRELDADVVVLNEVDFDACWSGHWNQAAILARYAGYPYRVEQRNVDIAIPFLRLRFGNAILSKYPILDAQSVQYPGYTLWETVLAGKKQGAVCTIQMPDGGLVHVLGVHLEHRSEAVRIASARRIEDVRGASALPLIVAGDFNSTPNHYPHAQPGADGFTALSMLLASGRLVTEVSEAPTAAQMTFHAAEPREAVDWILATPPAEVTRVDVVPSLLSDHRPIAACIRHLSP